MPIYEYACTACGHSLEALQKLSDPRLVTCPACHADALVKKVSAAGFQLKGSGWYATDFRSKGGAPARGDDAKADAAKGDVAKAGETAPSGDGKKSSGDGGTSSSAGTSAAQPAANAGSATSKTATPASGSSSGQA